MTAPQTSIASAGNVVLGLLLGALATLLVTRMRRQPAGALAGLYLGLVGANYLLDGLAKLLHGPVAVGDTLRHAGLVAVFFDPPVLLLAALAATGRRLTSARLASTLLPAGLLCGLYFVLPPAYPLMELWALNTAYAILLAAHYGLAFALIAQNYVHETAPQRRDKWGIGVILLGTIVLPRLVLLRYDAGLSPDTYSFSALLYHLVGLAATFGVTACALLAVAPRSQRCHVSRTLRALGGLLAAVGGFWTLLLTPHLQYGIFASIFSVRWFVAGAALTLGIQHYDILELPQRMRPWVSHGFTVAVLGLVGALTTAALAGIPDATVTAAAAEALTLLFVAVTLWHAFRHAVPLPPAEILWRRHAIYRAHLELEKPPEELAQVRAALGVSRDEHRAIHALVEAERRLTRRPDDRPRVGQSFLGRYRVERVVGVGAFGRTYSAWDEVSSERVALKELHPEWELEPGALEAFRREARIALEITHPNLVGFRGLEATAGGHVLILAHVEGETLRSLLARGPLPPDQVARVGREILAGLGALHEAGLTHRDVKPENVMVRPDGHAVLLDFGAAAASASGSATLRLHASEPRGTPGYASPEQLRGERCGPRSDLYSVGVLLWECLTGARPPAGDLPAEWAEPLRRALAPEPGDRWPRSQAFATALPPATHELQDRRTS